MSLAVLAASCAFSIIELQLSRPSGGALPVSIHEMARIATDQPLAENVGRLSITNQAEPPASNATELERLLATQLAERLGRPPQDVRFNLTQNQVGDDPRTMRKLELYGPEEFANQQLRGAFTFAVRDGAGWRVFTRHYSRTGLPLLWHGLLAGVILAMLVSLWFSGRLAHRIRAFTKAVRRVPAGRWTEPIPVKGPSEIRLAAVAINDMQARIARYVTERAAITGAIAHDLRAPLSRLRFHLHNAPAPILAAAEEEIGEMERLIATVLDFVEYDLRPPTSESVNLSLLIEGVADDLSDTGHDVRFTSAEQIKTKGDPLLLRRLFMNVAINAVKYGGNVAIGLTRSGNLAVVEVSDDGPGMSEADISRAFEPFYRGEPSRNRNTGGVGLGLAIAESAVAVHGGSISLTNKPDRGLLVRITIPIVEVRSAPLERQFEQA